jgi:hypothetical protein
MNFADVSVSEVVTDRKGDELGDGDGYRPTYLYLDQ